MRLSGLTVFPPFAIKHHRSMQMLIGTYNGTNYVARFIRSSEVIHWTVTLFRDSSDAGAELTGEIISLPDGEDDKTVRMEVEGLIPLCA